jgi:hypothetical protein
VRYPPLLLDPALAARYQAGELTLDDVAALLGPSPHTGRPWPRSTISRALKRVGVAPYRKGDRVLHPGAGKRGRDALAASRRRRARLLAARGHGAAEIARRLGVSPRWVRLLLES